MPRIIAVTNQKGGVGKTTLVCHLALAARENGLSVLVVDLDTQGNASQTLAGYPPPVELSSTGEVLAPAGAHRLFEDGDLTPLVTDLGVHLLFGHQHLDQVDDSSIENALSRTAAIRALPYDVVIIDTPPAIGVRQLAPLVWAHLVVIPIEPNEYSVVGLSHTLKTITSARSINPVLQHQVIVNKLDRRSNAQKKTVEELSALARIRQPHLTNRLAVSHALGQRCAVWTLKQADRCLRQTWRDLCQEIVAA